jgi:hypothetical protein
VDEIVYGLSKCYLPHHGIIYYNERQEPVASLSICFACDQIKIWSKETITFNEDYSKFDYKKAEKQMVQLEKLFIENDILVYTHPADWDQYAEKVLTLPSPESKDTLKLDAKIDDIDHVFFLHDPISIEEHKRLMSQKWAPKLDFKTTYDQKDQIRTYKSGNEYLIQYRVDPDGYGRLEQLEANGPHLFLPGGIRVGMSYEEITRLLNEKRIQRSYGCIQVLSKKYALSLTFENQTLKAIKLQLKE